MKNVTSLIMAGILLSATAVLAGWQETYDELLQKYVTPSGVKYKAWHRHAQDRRALKRIVDHVATQDVDSMEKDDRLAFYLNAYNAWILHTVLEAYPVESIKDLGLLVFRKKSLTVGGKKTSFHALENDVIRKQFKDARIHFALNCASKSCPPLYRRCFIGATLSETLDQLTRAFINKNYDAVFTTGGGKKVFVSKIFDWYQGDFVREGGSIVGYLNRYRQEKLLATAKVSYQTYDWSLNETE